MSTATIREIAPTTVDADGMLSRTMRILGCFTADEPELSASRLGVLTGLSSSTLHRILAQMLELGLLARTPGRRYAIGARLWELGELSPLALRLRETALPFMSRLYEVTGENVHLAVLDGPSPERATALYVGRLTGRTSIPTLSRMGGRQPLHTTGVGKALLATQSREWLDRFLSRPLDRETTHSITDPEAVRAEIDRARMRGYATTREEMTLGNVSVAAPVGTVAGLPPTAIGVVTRIEGADVRRLGALVVQTASELGRALRAA
ncbi:helix-turn-helix domain-containing protein [Microbacterium sp. MEC084]|uniref:IclR family transcriptional regulator n=1 Tax=unclassified Microbacterium TaxID=2609290 RepID=UPI00070051D6|nr:MULTISPECIES: IclR family transcriptional regulator [unclassified Microbacterium]KQZ07972.1 transcriptional regulator [Microbacterium sp. Root53]MCD1269297.1 helix-turn-helix domain-containing protein [Microbacterium sp. MEC084]